MAFPILGTMNFGSEGQVKMSAAQGLLSSFAGSGCAKTPCGAMVDTARIYQHAFPEGDTETTLGQIFQSLPSLQKRCHIATKASPQWSLSKASVIEQCNTSLEKLGVDCIDLFYLHAPDIRTDINDTLEGIDQLHKEGKIKEFGLSNYPAWAVVDIWHRCKNRQMILPTVYQGAYNVITRDMEREIVPVARHFGLRLYMYNPLAGGLLSGRYTKMEDVTNATSGRFSSEFDSAFGKTFKAGTEIYRKRYAKEPVFEALEILLGACPKLQAEAPEVVHDKTTVVEGQRVRLVVSESKEPPRSGPSLAEVALRWLIHHSYLRKGDGIIIGASKQDHLVANLAAWQAGPLPAPLLEACEAAWAVSRSCCEAYFRGYGALPGGIEAFLSLQDEAEHVQKKNKVSDGTEQSS
ncbi:Aflatoxin B1 aldehyde reductase member 2 (rAFAR2) (Succinic semialdehyde reductase) (SSA reductase) [Durusdinium trenchii]|uniref:Aflatoxin B1 aldehyde reductase member 2 (RAFAR2) (Succinic semialdehyde reductase) (SSA reductase) n=1 Tax=Durusdinium trenchii TaxID=1381693 RepID=A0ABP0JUZ9_9DINO